MATCFRQSNSWKISRNISRCATNQFQRLSCNKSIPRVCRRTDVNDIPAEFQEQSTHFFDPLFHSTLINNTHLQTRLHMMNSKKINKLQRSSNHSSQKLCSRETENNNNIDDQDFIFLHGISRDAYKKSNYCGDDIILKESSSMSNYSLKYLDFEKINLPEENIKPNDVLSLSCITTIKNTNDLSVPRSLSYCVSNFNNTAIQSNKNVNEDDLVPNEDKLQRICKNLAHHLPKLFIHRQDYSIYHHNVIFYNNITGVTKEGLQQYSMYLSKIKALGHLLYARINMNILKITSHPEDGTVRIRWRISIVTFWKLFSKFRKTFIFNSKVSDENFERYIDGFSIFYIGNDGLIYKHECDEVMPDDNYEISKSKKPGWMALIFSGLTRDSSNSLKSSVFRTVNQHNTR